jgi:hypothetical protein
MLLTREQRLHIKAIRSLDYTTHDWTTWSAVALLIYEATWSPRAKLMRSGLESFWRALAIVFRCILPLVIGYEAECTAGGKM